MTFIAASLVVLMSSSASPLFAADEGRHLVISSTVLRTLAITAPLPEYPASSVAAGHEGRAVVVLTYDERGVPKCGRKRVKEDFCRPRVARQYLELWKEQVETAGAPRTRRHPMHDYDAYFSHYAGQFVDDNSTIIVSTASEPDGHSIGGFGLSERRAQEIRGLLSFCENRPKLVSEARRAGFLLHTVLWAAKKGIVQVCPAVGALLG